MVNSINIINNVINKSFLLTILFITIKKYLKQRLRIYFIIIFKILLDEKRK